jgi:putative solute:sodium symporter small subunit
VVSALLAAWAVVSFLVLFFAREMDGFNFFGWPLPLYLAGQGLLLFYVLLLAIYSIAMRSIERAEQERD